MHRRSMILGGVAAAALSPLKAAETFVNNTPMGPLRRAYVDHPTVIKQNCQLWCWAASSSMIFASHGHQVPQQQIVQKLFGATVCASSGMHPLGPTGTITATLSSPWMNISGTTFSPHIVAAYDAYRSINAINNNFIINELTQSRPLLYCNRTHAMVVVAIEYIATPMGPNPTAVGVIDPYPGSPDFHLLSGPEMVPAHMGGDMTYVASVHI